MSSRAARKLLKEKQSQKEEVEVEEEEEIEEEVPRVKNAFDLLLEEEGNNDEEETVEEVAEEEVEDEEEEEEENKQKNRPKNSKNPKKNDQKGKKNRSRKNKKSQPKEEDEEKIFKKFAEKNSEENGSTFNGKEEVNEEDLLLETKSEFLNPDNELVKLFGKQTIKEAAKEGKKGTRDYWTPKKYSLIKPRGNWPQVPSGLSMDFIGSENGHNYFTIVQNANYKKIQEEFFYCVQSFDPSSFQGLLQIYPYHVDSLLQLSNVCNQTGQFDMAMDMMERALFAFESSWHALFNPLLGNCRLPYHIEENKCFYLAIFKFITMLGREGTSRTALEYSKLLLSLDLSDPLFILFIMDYYSIRSGQYQFVLEMYASKRWDEKRLSTLPNWNYSLALAKFKMEQQKKESNKSSESQSEPKKSIEALMNQSSDQLLQHALMLFPMVLAPLAKKGGFQMTRTDPVSKINEDMTQHAFFTDFPVNPKNLQQIVTLFVERNFTLWKDPEVVKWVKKNVEEVISRIHKGDVTVTNFSTILQEEYVSNERDLFDHLLLSEYTDNIAANALPPDVLNAMRGGGQVEIYQGFREAQAARAANAPRIHATTNNPALLFLQTLMPWNATPNAPPLP